MTGASARPTAPPLGAVPMTTPAMECDLVVREARIGLELHTPGGFALAQIPADVVVTRAVCGHLLRAWLAKGAALTWRESTAALAAAGEDR